MNGQSPSGLDHFYTNRPEKLSVIETHFTGASDHKLIFANRYSKIRKQTVRYVRKRCYKNFDHEAFLSELSNVRWWDIYQCNDVDLSSVSILL